MTNRLQKVQIQRGRRMNRVRARLNGTAERPRLHVTITNQNVMVQIIDDEKHATIAASSTVGQKMTGKSMTEKAIWVGTDIAEKAKAKKIKTVVFDRGAKLYHGRVKALAEAARAAGMEF